MEFIGDQVYAKPPLTFEEQADLLICRGLIGSRNDIIKRLEMVSYYRLSGYLYPFRKVDEAGKVSDLYERGTTLSEVWLRYCFDRRLRMLILDAIERFEVSLRSKVIHNFCLRHGPFGYGDQSNFLNFSNGEYLEWRTSLEEETRRSKEPFVRHFRTKYGKRHALLPFWMMAELMSLGSTVTLFRKSESAIQKEIANQYGVTDEVLGSWMLSLYSVRNICAHHARLWNRKLGVAPQLPRPPKSPLWPKDAGFAQDRIGSILLICRYLLRVVSPSSCWHQRVEGLFQEYCEVPVADMGMPNDWKQHPIWSERSVVVVTPLHP